MSWSTNSWSKSYRRSCALVNRQLLKPDSCSKSNRGVLCPGQQIATKARQLVKVLQEVLCPCQQTVTKARQLIKVLQEVLCPCQQTATKAK